MTQDFVEASGKDGGRRRSHSGEQIRDERSRAIKLIRFEPRSVNNGLDGGERFEENAATK